jgi:hypothetical protein
MVKNISSKELNYVKDFLSWELLAAKKCNDHASKETDQNSRQIFTDCAQLHQQNYSDLLNYVSQLQGGQSN